jgi:hypothetical protein
MIKKGREREADEKGTCKPLGKQITLETINKLKQKLGYRNRGLGYYKTRIPECPAEATLTEIDYDADVAKMKKIPESQYLNEGSDGD